MKSTNFSIFFKYANAIPFDIYLPEVIYDEIVNKYQEFLKNELEGLDKCRNKINRLSMIPLPETNIDIQVALKLYKDHLETLIARHKIKLLSYPKVPHKEIVQSIFNKEKPFKENGDGYRDKLILETLKESFSIPNETIIFISNNTHDFGTEPAFIDSIKEQLCNPHLWTIKNSLQSFIDEYLQPLFNKETVDDAIYHLITDYILSKSFRDLIDNSDVGYDIMGLEYGYGNIFLIKLDLIKDIHIEPIMQKENDNIYSVKLSAYYIFSVSANDRDCIRSTSWRDYFEYRNGEEFISISSQSRQYAEVTFLVNCHNNSVISAEIKFVKSPMGIFFDYTW